MSSTIGGLLQTVDAMVKASFAASALTSDATISLRPLDVLPHPTGENIAIRSFALEALDDNQNPVTSFAQPITLTVDFTDEEVAGLAVDNIHLAFWNGTTWENIPGDLDGHRLTANIEHLSDFALFSTLPPAPPSVTPKVFLPSIQSE